MIGSIRTPLLAGAAMLAVTTGAPAHSQAVGIAASVAGDVRIAQSSGGNESDVARRQRISLGNVVRTRKKGELDILLLDRSTFSIGERTRIVIDEFVYDPNERRSMGATVLEGAFRFFSGRRTPNSRANVRTPTGTIGIRGTAVDGIIGEEARDIARDEPSIPRGTDHDKDTATLVVLRGPGAATEAGLTPGVVDVTAAGVTVTLDSPGLAAYIPRPGAPPIGPFRISTGGLSKVQDEQQTRVTRAAKSGPGLGGILAGIAVVAGAAILLSDGGDDPPSSQDGGSDDTADDNCHIGPNGERHCGVF